MRTQLYLLAAIPATFPATVYLYLAGCAIVYLYRGFDGPLLPETGSLLWHAGRVSVGVGLIQWPAYVLWAALSKELSFRARVYWIVLLLCLNILAIPYFLYCKCRRQAWPPVGMPDIGRSGPYQFSLRSLLLAIGLLAILLLSIRLMIRVWQSLNIETMSVRVTSSGTIPWGNDVLHVSEMHSQIEGAVESFRSYGLKTRLLIECYNDTRESDVEVLRAMAHDVGVEVVDTQYDSWPSPDWSKKEE